MKKMSYALLLIGFLVCLCACMSTARRTAGEMADDTAIASTIKTRIVEDRELSFLKINTDVFKGNVTLFGVVPNKQAEEQLVALAKSVKGVKSVTSKLMIQQK